MVRRVIDASNWPCKGPYCYRTINNTAGGMNGFKTWLKAAGVTPDNNSLLVIENTGVYHRLLCSSCSKHNLPLHIGNTANIKWSLGITRGKNGVIDSVRLLATNPIFQLKR